MMKAIAICAMFAALAAAQEPQSEGYRGLVRLNRAPVSTDVLKVKLPRAVERRLSNGLRLLVIESHRAPTISLTIDTPSTNLRDPDGLPGLAEATGALMTLGTTMRSARQIADALAEIGATLSIGGGGGGGRGGRGGGGADGTISLSSLTENFDDALAILADVLLHPSFPADELDKWKTRQRSALEQAATNPTTLGSDAMLLALYPNDARHVTRPTAESLGKITRDDLIAHYKKYFVPSGELAGVAGDITPQDAVAKLEKALSGWKGGPIERLSLPIAAPIA